MSLSRLSTDILKIIGVYLDSRDNCNITATTKWLYVMVQWKETLKRIWPFLLSVQIPLLYSSCRISVVRRWCILLYNVRTNRKICGVCHRLAETHYPYTIDCTDYVHKPISVADYHVPDRKYSLKNLNLFSNYRKDYYKEQWNLTYCIRKVNWKCLLVCNNCEPFSSDAWIVEPTMKYGNLLPFLAIKHWDDVHYQFAYFREDIIEMGL